MASREAVRRRLRPELGGRAPSPFVGTPPVPVGWGCCLPRGYRVCCGMPDVDYRVDLLAVRSGMDEGPTFWAQARAGAIPGEGDRPPTVIVTAQPALRTGSDVFHALSEWRTSDFGRTWDGPHEQTDTLGRRQEPDGVTVAICGTTPQWHAATRSLLATGQTVRYRDDKGPITERARETAYAVRLPDGSGCISKNN